MAVRFRYCEMMAALVVQGALQSLLAAYTQREESARNALKAAEREHREMVKTMKVDKKKRQKIKKALKGVSLDEILSAAAAKHAAPTSSTAGAGSGS